MDDELIEQRFDLVDDRFEHCERRLDALEQAKGDAANAKESRRSWMVNWLMVGLFVAEVIIGAAELWMMRHA